MPSFIDDGCTVDATIPARTDLHDELKFSFRPMTARQRMRFWDGFFKLDADKQFDRYVKAMVEQITKWSHDKPPVAATFEGIHWLLFDDLTAKVIGVKPETDEKN